MVFVLEAQLSKTTAAGDRRHLFEVLPSQTGSALSLRLLTRLHTPTLTSGRLDGDGDALAAADAERDDALLGAGPLHAVQQRDEAARARGADRMADGDRSAAHVHLGHASQSGQVSVYKASH